MRVETGKQAALGRRGGIARQAAPGDQAGQKIECRALVVTAPAVVPKTRTLPRQAAFLAHLIATQQQAPQTRERRRVEPNEALAAYRATANLLRR